MKICEQRRAVAWLTVLCLALPGLASARQGRLIGKVVDPEGKPITGVRVTTTCPEVPEFNEVTTTNEKGIFRVDFERINVVYLYEFEKAGYERLKVEQKWTVEGTERHEFALLPAPAPPLGGLDPAAAPASASTPAIVAYNAGFAAFKTKDYATAATRFQEAAGHDPKLRPAWVGLVAVYMDQRRYREAAEAAEKALALGATDASILKSRWEAYRELGDTAKEKEAREELERVGRLGEEAKRIYNDGVTWTKIGDDKEAFAKFKEAVELDPNFELALLGLATSALKLERPADASAAAETLLKTDPLHAEALKIRYNAALKLGDEARIVDALLGLAAVDATTGRDGLFQLGSGAFQRDDRAKAKQRFREVLEIDPAHARAHYLLGLIFMGEGAKGEARAHLERFLALAPDDPDAGTARDALKYLK